MTYEIFYDKEEYCAEMVDLEKAIKWIKRAVKDNPKCKGKYEIRLFNMIIWKY